MIFIQRSMEPPKRGGIAAQLFERKKLGPGLRPLSVPCQQKRGTGRQWPSDRGAPYNQDMDSGTIEPRLREFLKEREGIAAAYLFGSVARGTAGPRSDVD